MRVRRLQPVVHPEVGARLLLSRQRQDVQHGRLRVLVRRGDARGHGAAVRVVPPGHDVALGDPVAVLVVVVVARGEAVAVGHLDAGADVEVVVVVVARDDAAGVAEGVELGGDERVAHGVVVAARGADEIIRSASAVRRTRREAVAGVEVVAELC